MGARGPLFGTSIIDAELGGRQEETGRAEGEANGDVPMEALD